MSSACLRPATFCGWNGSGSDRGMCDVLHVSLILRTGWPILYGACVKVIVSLQDVWTTYWYALR